MLLLLILTLTLLSCHGTGASTLVLPDTGTLEQLKARAGASSGVLTKPVLALLPNHSCNFDFSHLNLGTLMHRYQQHLEFVCVPRSSATIDLLHLLNATSDDTAIHMARGLRVAANSRFDHIQAHSTDDFNLWVHEHMSVLVAFVNKMAFPVSLFWVSDGQDTFLTTVQPGTTYPSKTYPGHTFQARDLEGKVLKEVTIELAAEVSIDEDSICTESNGTCERAVQAPSSDILLARESSDRGRLQQNVVQPKRVYNFTEVGFKVAQIPTDLWLMMKDFWQSNKHLKVREAWSPEDTHTNHWESDIFVLQLPTSMKDAVFEVMKPRLQAWANVSDLVPTSCYGIREYGNGSILAEHVDRIKTHAVSAIMQIDQQVDEPWGLTVRDHTDATHWVYLEPGQMVYYESAKCLHGRPKAFKGTSFANVFVHFMPSVGWNY